MNNKVDSRELSRRKRKRVHAGSIEMRPHKWPQQAAFILSEKKQNPGEELTGQRNLGLVPEG